MIPGFGRFLLKLLLFSLVIAVGLYFWKAYMPAKFNSPLAWYSLAYFVVITLAVHAFLSSTQGKPKQFVQSFMLVTGLKLFLNLTIVVTVFMVHKPGAVSFAVTFLCLYFLFLIFEVVVLMRGLKR